MKTSKKFFALIMALVMCSMLAIPVFASDGSFPDYASHWYNSTDSSKKMTVYVKGNPNANKTGMTLGVNSFGSNTAVYYEVYNNSTGKLLTSTSKSRVPAVSKDIVLIVFLGKNLTSTFLPLNP